MVESIFVLGSILILYNDLFINSRSTFIYVCDATAYYIIFISILLFTFSDNFQNVGKYPDMSTLTARISDSWNSNRAHWEINNSTSSVKIERERERNKEKQEEE